MKHSFPRAPVARACLAALALAAGTAQAATYALSSPNGKLVLTVSHDTGSGTLSYSVAKGSNTLLEPARLGIVTSLADLSTGLAFVGRDDAKIKDTYKLPGHKKAKYKDSANQMTLSFSHGSTPLQLVVRAYNDGIAWRYAVPGTGSINILSENSAFNLPDSAGGWAQSYTAFNDNYERAYTPQANFDSGIFTMPALAHVGNDWLLMVESDIGGTYQSSHFSGNGGNVLQLVPHDSSAISDSLPFQSPWRLAMIGGLDDIVEGTLMENLSAPSQIADTSWIHPGRSAWSWMAGASQSDFNAQLPYVDQAAAMGWEYYLCDEGWQDSWVPQIVSYAAARNVGIVLWVGNGDVNAESKARSLFSKWAGWGVKGVKVDFFDGDGQATMQDYEMLARVAADNHLFIDFHGATKPNGLSRKWPNILTHEGVAGAEQRNLAPSHNVTLMFTRNAIGPMDYTPVDFGAIADRTTWAHQVALSVAFSSYLQHFSDNWATYRDSVAVDFLRAVPTVWDDTRLVEGLPDQYATIARRRGDEWYLGAISALATPRTAQVALDFLKPGVRYTALIYRDGLSQHDIAYETRTVTSTDTLSLALAINGGAAVRITTHAPSSALQNLAAGKPTTSDSACDATEGSNKANNGSVANGKGDKWCSTGANKWWRVDLGATYNLSNLTLRHAGAGGEAAKFNTRDFTVQASTDDTNWSDIVNVSGNTADTTTHPLSNVNARYLKLNVTKGVQSGTETARIYEFEAYGQGAYDTRAHYKIVSRSSGKALAVKNADIGDNAAIVQWDYGADNTSNDEWRLVDAGGGYYAIVNLYSGKALDVSGASTDNGAPLVQYASRGATNQQWQLVATDSGFVRIVGRNSGQVIDVTGNSLDNGTVVEQFPWINGANQQWQLVKLP